MAEVGEKKEGFYKRYMRVMNKIGDIQGRGILILLYFTVFLLPGAALATFGDRLQIKRKPTAWQDRTDQENTIERAREQW
jgi:hypothetical protein